MGNLSWIEAIYWAATVVGGMLFLFRLVLMFIGGLYDGGDFDGDASAGMDTDLDADLELEHADSDVSFKLLSMQGLTAFFMMFGLSGLTLLSADLHRAWVILGSTAVGLFAVWVVSLLFAAVKGLQEDGTVRIENAVGQVGTVYLRIPADGQGQVRISIQGRSRIYDAAAVDNTEIRTGETVTVVRVTGRMLVVERASK